jgi:hypothetical protein
MKTLVVLVLVSLSAFVQARSVSVTGNGYATGFCDGSAANFFCFDNLKNQARRDAVSRAELDCRIRGGQAQPVYVMNCGFEYCNPSYIPANGPSQMVTCRTDCSVTCDIKE